MRRIGFFALMFGLGLSAASAQSFTPDPVDKAAALEAQSNPLLLQLKSLEVEKARVERWDGKYPTWFFGAGATPPNLLVQTPLPGGVNSGLK